MSLHARLLPRWRPGGAMMGAIVLIDFENVYRSLELHTGMRIDRELIRTLIERIREYARDKGGPVLGVQAYANFIDIPRFRSTMSQLQMLNVDPCNVPTKGSADDIRQNASDVDLAVDAMELLFTRPDIDHYVLVCGDRDLISLIRKLRRWNKSVHVIAVAATASRDLATFADDVATVEELLGYESSPADEIVRLAEELHQLEQERPFVGLQWFMRYQSGGDRVCQRIFEMVNSAIRQEIMYTYKVPNPRGEFPTTALRLNPEHELARMVMMKMNQPAMEPDHEEAQVLSREELETA